MRRYLLISLLAMAPAAQAADFRPIDMTAASPLSGTEAIWCQLSGPVDRKCTTAQIATYIFGQVSGDCTIAAGVITCTRTNGTSFGSLATATPGTGVLTALGVNIGSAGAFTTFSGAHGTPSSITLTNGTGLPIAGITGLGANVVTALAVALSGAGGMTTTVATGTAALGTSAIASGVCGTATTVAATGVATTDTINAGFNGDPTAITGYTAGGMLTVVPYPTSGNVNFKQCNLTAISITPGALTINWRVQR